MIIAVGSQNPVKLAAVKTAFTKIFPEKTWQVAGLEVESGVSEQPLSDVEMIKGAKQRAREALRQNSKAHYGVGLEGGLYRLAGEWFGRSWIVVSNKNGKLGIGSSVSCPMPANFMELVHQGKTLSEVCEILYGLKDIGKKDGYFGLLTNNHITRTSGYSDAVIMALSVFHQPKLKVSKGV